MNKQELIAMMDARKPDPHQKNYSKPLPCYGCAHSAATADFPGEPSGERPCCTCIRNPEREQWLKDHAKMPPPERTLDEAIEIDNEGNARVFDPYRGTMYNGAPLLYYPMDNYVTLSRQDQEDWLDANPEYKKAVRTHGGKVQVAPFEN